MNPLYVVRNPFNAHGVFYEVGTVIDDPSSIWTFRSRLGARDVVELTADDPGNCSVWLDYMESRTQNPIDARIYQMAGRELPEGHPEKVIVPKPAAKPAATAAKTPVATAVKPAAASK